MIRAWLRTLVASSALFTALAASNARAQGPATDPSIRELARQAYDRGAAALARDDFVAAASEFLRADSMAPSNVALTAAAAATARANDAALAARLLNHAGGRANDAELAAKVAEIKKRFEAGLGRIKIECRASSCIAKKDGEEIPSGQPRWVAPGRIELMGEVDRQPFVRTEDVAAGAEVTVVLEPPTTNEPSTSPPSSSSPAATPAETRSGGPSPAWFWIAGGATVIAAGVSTWSTLEVLSIRSDYDAAKCASVGSTRCTRLADDGQGADTRTVVLWAVTGGLAVTTAVLGLFFVRWSDAPRTTVGFSTVPGGASATAAMSW